MAGIILRDVSLSYISGGIEVRIFDRMDFRVLGPGLIAVIGESGSGKSSLLNIIAGYQTPDKGQVHVSCPPQRLGFVFQSLYLISHLDVMSNVGLPLILLGSGRKAADAASAGALAEVGLAGFGRRKINELSGGQKARVSLARCLVGQNEIILADEPTGSLDSESVDSVFRLLKKMSRERLIIVVTHNEKAARKYAEHIYEIKDGKLSEAERQGKTTEFIRQPDEKIFEPKPCQTGKIRLAESIGLSLGFLGKHLFRYAVSLFFAALCFGFIASLFDFAVSGREVLHDFSRGYFDFSCLKLSEKKTYEIPGQKLELLKTVRLTDDSETKLSRLFPDLEFYPCIDDFLLPYTDVTADSGFLPDKSFFLPSFPEASKLKSGNIPLRYNEIVVSSSFLACNAGIGIGSVLGYKNDIRVETSYLSKNVRDVVSLSLRLKICGISAERDLLARPVIYYDYRMMLERLFSLPLPEASAEFDLDLSLEDRLTYLSDEDDSLTSFKTIVRSSEPSALNDASGRLSGKITCESVAIEVSESISELIVSLTRLVSYLLLLSLACSFLLEWVVIENIYRLRKKEFALYLSFGFPPKELFSIGLGQSAIFAAILLFMTYLIKSISSAAGNMILAKYGFPSFLSPFSSPLSFAAMACGATLFSLLAGSLPLMRLRTSDLIQSLREEQND